MPREYYRLQIYVLFGSGDFPELTGPHIGEFAKHRPVFPFNLFILHFCEIHVLLSIFSEIGFWFRRFNFAIFEIGGVSVHCSRFFGFNVSGSTLPIDFYSSLGISLQVLNGESPTVRHRLY